jgi:hypothetical protein
MIAPKNKTADTRTKTLMRILDLLRVFEVLKTNEATSGSTTTGDRKAWVKKRPKGRLTLPQVRKKGQQKLAWHGPGRLYENHE